MARGCSRRIRHSAKWSSPLARRQRHRRRRANRLGHRPPQARQLGGQSRQGPQRHPGYRFSPAYHTGRSASRAPRTQPPPALRRKPVPRLPHTVQRQNLLLGYQPRAECHHAAAFIARFQDQTLGEI